METYVHLKQYLALFFLEREVLQTKPNIHFMFSKFFPPENRTVYEDKWKNTLQPDRPQVTLQCCAEKVRSACRKTKQEYLKLNTLFMFIRPTIGTIY